MKTALIKSMVRKGIRIQLLILYPMQILLQSITADHPQLHKVLPLHLLES